jgi:ribonuclease J
VELESSGQRILLDLGLPLNTKDAALMPLPAIAGLAKADPSLLAIILSHGHRDHWGLVPKAFGGIPIVMGKAAEQIIARSGRLRSRAVYAKVLILDRTSELLSEGGLFFEDRLSI